MKANAIEEQAEATEELIANLTEAHTHQIESLIKANTVIGHGIGGTNFPDIMARLAKMQDHWVSDTGLHPISRPVKSVMAKRSTYVDITYYREFLT